LTAAKEPVAGRKMTMRKLGDIFVRLCFFVACLTARAAGAHCDAPYGTLACDPMLRGQVVVAQAAPGPESSEQTGAPAPESSEQQSAPAPESSDQQAAPEAESDRQQAPEAQGSDQQSAPGPESSEQQAAPGPEDSKQ
jgi:hypothetical protein